MLRKGSFKFKLLGSRAQSCRSGRLSQCTRNGHRLESSNSKEERQSHIRGSADQVGTLKFNSGIVSTSKSIRVALGTPANRVADGADPGCLHRRQPKGRLLRACAHDKYQRYQSAHIQAQTRQPFPGEPTHTLPAVRPNDDRNGIRGSNVRHLEESGDRREIGCTNMPHASRICVAGRRHDRFAVLRPARCRFLLHLRSTSPTPNAAATAICFPVLVTAIGAGSDDHLGAS